MAKRGPIPKPTALRVIEGNPGKRPLPPNEPKPMVAAPSCPKHLKPKAKAEWRRISKQLLKLGLLTQVDRAVLAAYCQSWARWVEAEEEVAKRGDVVATTKGNWIQNPYLSVANKAREAMTKLAAEFGMTPSSRTRVEVPAAAAGKNDFSGNGKRV